MVKSWNQEQDKNVYSQILFNIIMEVLVTVIKLKEIKEFKLYKKK